ncbi:PACE efflux transporter [Comamonas sp. GB3 AK4-5]|uniref:PACE efflux transporter n=1 Tax=Comamonas sp. GB3 AK4-5 TaxID=3231487 RepID=UPI00351DC7EF
MSKPVSAMAPATSLSAASSPVSTAPSASPKKPTGLQGPWRRVVFVGLYELIAIIVSSLLFMATGQNSGDSGVMAVAASTIAIAWNLTFNWLFEQWELRQTQKGRSLLRRIAHAIGFEGGIAAMLIPLMAWWFDISLWEATVLEAGLLVFFMLYTFVFNWAFDRIFGLPASAQNLQP